DLPKDRRSEVYRFRPPRGEAKGGGGAFHLLGKSKLCSRKNAHRRCGILRRSKPSSTSVEVDCPKLVTDLGRPRFDVVETVVTHGRGTPLTSRSPQPFLLPEPAQNSKSCKALRALRRPRETFCEKRRGRERGMFNQNRCAGSRRLHLRAFKPRDHATHADAANLFVIGEREVDRPGEWRGDHVRVVPKPAWF